MQVGIYVRFIFMLRSYDNKDKSKILSVQPQIVNFISVAWK